MIVLNWSIFRFLFTTCTFASCDEKESNKWTFRQFFCKLRSMKLNAYVLIKILIDSFSIWLLKSLMISKRLRNLNLSLVKQTLLIFNNCNNLCIKVCWIEKMTQTIAFSLKRMTWFVSTWIKTLILSESWRNAWSIVVLSFLLKEASNWIESHWWHITNHSCKVFELLIQWAMLIYLIEVWKYSKFSHVL